MNILHPTLGDLIDRAVILELKRLINFDFIKELIEVEKVILQRSRALDLIALDCLRSDLRDVHRQIWDINTQFDHLDRFGHDFPANHLGLQAWRLNQDRIRILERIDTMSGEFSRPEKVY